jgi:hypothetical protein
MSTDRTNTIKSTDPVTVLLVHREDVDGEHVVSVGGVFARPEFADRQVAALSERFPDAKINAVGVFFDAAATLYPGFRIEP